MGITPPTKNPVARFLEDVSRRGASPHRKPKRWDGALQTTFYVRVIPILGGKIGEPSNSVIVHYGLPEPQPVTAETGPLYDVQLLSFTPYRAADPKYAKCAVLNQDIQYCQPVYALNPFGLGQYNLHIQNVLKQAEASGNLGSYKYQYPDAIIVSQKCETKMPKGTQSCGCPGVSCSSSGSSCGWDDPISCAQDGSRVGRQSAEGGRQTGPPRPTRT